MTNLDQLIKSLPPLLGTSIVLAMIKLTVWSGLSWIAVLCPMMFWMLAFFLVGGFIPLIVIVLGIPLAILFVLFAAGWLSYFLLTGENTHE